MKNKVFEKFLDYEYNNHASEKIYSSDNSLDMKLLYVAVTRALHELDIVYSGNLTKPLENHLKKNKDNSLVRVK